jgi:iron complex outermembrane recepter protein
LVNLEPLAVRPWTRTDNVQLVSEQSFGGRLHGVTSLAACHLLCSMCVIPICAQGDAIIENKDIPNIIVTEKYLVESDELVSSKIALPASDVPLSAERLNSNTIERSGFRTLGPLLQASTSAVANPASGGAFNEILLRGFGNAPVFRNGLNDSAGTLPIRSLANVESIEVLKGPYGALYGPGEPGGSINFVTKSPQSDPSTEMTASFGSYDDLTFQLDSTGPLLDSGDLNYRFIAQREESDTFRDFGDQQRWFVNPMLAWQPREDLRFDATFEYIHDNRRVDTGIVAFDNAIRLNANRFLGEPATDPANVDGYTLQLSSDYQLRNDWQVNFDLHVQRTLYKGAGVEPDALEATDTTLLLNRFATQFVEASEVLIAQAELSGVGNYWNMPHHLLFGTSATGVNEDNEFFGSDPDADPFAINPFSPIYGQLRPSLELERDSSEHTRQVSLYAQDLLEIGTHWRLLLGLRYDHIEQSGSDAASSSRFNRTSDELSPRVGLVFKPTLNWSWFASFSTSIEPNVGLQPDGSGLAPTKSKSVELGVKWKSDRYPVSSDAAIFGMRQTNVTTDAPGDPGFELQTGEQESIGTDVEVKFDPTSWLSLRGHYNFVDAQILNDVVVSNGTTPLNVAKHQVGALSLITTSLVTPDDLSISLALNYLSERQGSLEPDELNLRLAGYFKGDVFISWRYSKQLRLEFGVESFTDKNYIQGSQADGLHLFPGNPVRFRGQINLSF